jgi:hypothetical protein
LAVAPVPRGEQARCGVDVLVAEREDFGRAHPRATIA